VVFKPTLDDHGDPEALESCMGPMDHRNEMLHRHEHMVALVEAAVIATCVQEEIVIRIQGILSGDKYPFQEHRVEKALDWLTEDIIEWLDMVSVARAAYIANLTQ
jgi:hypothetical protein